MKQPWLKSARSDVAFILSPPFFSLAIVFLFPTIFQQERGMPVMYWLILVVFIDVAHVYSTLYRSYFNPIRLRRLPNLFLVVPLSCYALGVMLYHTHAMLFWSVLAYLAVFHFVRQQYGFMRLYSRFEHQNRIGRGIDALAIYAATIYPLLFWHFDGNRNFSWFIEGDFLIYPSDTLLTWCSVGYVAVIVTYIAKECYSVLIKKILFNIPKNLLMLGTFLSWYFGIVYFNGDIAFTVLNVISHGIPYIALIRFFEEKDYERNQGKKSTLMKISFGKFGLPVFLSVLVLLAYLEEGLWDGLIWKEHQVVFSFFSFFPRVDDALLLSLLIPLLAVPQATHYVLDGFIWRKDKV